MRNRLLLYINGKRHEISGNQAFMTLSDYLRYDLAATGTKVVCAEGDCGACTVMLGRLKEGELAYKPVNACIQYLYQLDCTHVVTVEGLRSGEALNPVQEAMMACHGAQCGYCTPGFIVAMCGLFDERKQAAEAGPVQAGDIRDALTGNLCRCTGYEPIIQAGLSVAEDRVTGLHRLYPPQEMISTFTDALKVPVRLEGVNFDGQPRLAFIPVSLPEAVAFKASHPGLTVIQGGTDVSVVCNKRGFEPAVIMSLSNLVEPGLEEISLQKSNPPALLIGAKATLSQLETLSATACPELHAILETFGGPQIKQAGTLAGNVANGSPIADSTPFLMVMNAEVELTGVNGSRRVNMNDFYTGYKQNVMAPDELITRFECPLPAEDEILKLYKVSRRKHLDISTFTAAFLMRLDGQNRIASIRIAYGGVAATVVRLPGTEAFLTGRPFELGTFEEAGTVAVSEISPLSDVRGSSAYRNLLAENILQKFFFDAQAREAVPA